MSYHILFLLCVRCNNYFAGIIFADKEKLLTLINCREWCSLASFIEIGTDASSMPIVIHLTGNGRLNDAISLSASYFISIIFFT